MFQILNLIALILAKASPLLLAAFGGLLSELGGVINFALEGMMLAGAFAAVLGTWATGSCLVGFLFAVFSGALMGAVHAGACLKLRANQIVSSIAVNLMAAGITGFLLNQVFQVYGTSPGVETLPNLASILPQAGVPAGLLRLAQGTSILAPAALAVSIAVTAFLSRTVPGLRLRACGENPEAARAAGLMVRRTQFFAVCAGGALAGMGGAYLSIGVLSQFVENITQGRGYLAVAAVILGRWRPMGVFLAVFFFGFAEAVSEWFAVRWPGLPNQLFLVMPYVTCFAVLALCAGRRGPPSALGRAEY
jgi:simple sugar transport system permease protein